MMVGRPRIMSRLPLTEHVRRVCGNFGDDRAAMLHMIRNCTRAALTVQITAHWRGSEKECRSQSSPNTERACEMHRMYGEIRGCNHLLEGHDAESVEYTPLPCR